MLTSSKEMIKYQADINSALAKENRDWQERLANSAHQREIADLKAAGLNPVLTVSGGSGANTPSGATAQASDGSGYLSALLSLEAAKINSAASLDIARMNNATQVFTHTTPGASTIPGAINWYAEQLGLPVSELLGDVGNRTGLSSKSKSPLSRLFSSNIISLGPMMDSYSSAHRLRSLKSDDVTDYMAGHYGRFAEHSTNFVRGNINKRQYSNRVKKDDKLLGILAALYPEEWKKVYGEYPFKGLENNRRLKYANRKK